MAGCGCGGRARETITTADAEAMRLAKANGDKYVVTDTSGAVVYSGSDYMAAAKARRTVNGKLANAR